jgi:hypothetical protein
MKRAITFENAEEFGFVHQGFIVGGAMIERRTIVELRNIAKILDKLDGISESSITEGKEDKYPTGDTVRKYTEGDLVLTNDEHALILSHMERTPWTVKISRKVVALIDKIKDCEERPDISPISPIEKKE